MLSVTMNQWILLKFINNNGEGYQVLAELWDDNRQIVQSHGELSSIDRLFEAYSHWQDRYRTFIRIVLPDSPPQAIDSSPEAVSSPALPDNDDDIGIELEDGFTNGSRSDLDSLWDLLKQELDRWLGETSFAAIDRSLRSHLHKNDEILINIQTDDPKLWRLPWPRWNFLHRYRNAEVILSPLENEAIPVPTRERGRLLAVFGYDPRCDTSEDSELLKRIEDRGIKCYDLKEMLQKDNLTSEDVDKALFDDAGWSIFFFAGHSSSSNTALYIRPYTPLYLSTISNALQHAINKGLQLAILNSCDGTAHARELLDFKLPRAIVMREIVPNTVAKKFLDNFLEEFCKGKSLPVALRTARVKLQKLEHEYPYASWLPVLCQNATVPLLTLESLGGKRRRESESFWQTISRKVKAYIKEKYLFWSALFLVGFLSGILAHAIYINSVTKVAVSSDAASTDSRISMGEETLFARNKDNLDLQRATKAFQERRYRKARIIYKNYLQKYPNNPEIRIYYNNAIAADEADEQTKPIRIGISIPISKNPNVAEQIMRGAALKQEAINNKDNPGINGRLLQFVIADDKNDADTAKDIARKLIADKSILAVIGPNASDVTYAVKDLYIKGKLVAITPTSFADRINNETEGYIFRMVPDLTYFAGILRKRIFDDIRYPNIFLLFDNNPTSYDTQDFKTQFEKAYLNETQTYTKNEQKKYSLNIRDYLIGQPSFSPERVIQDIQNLQNKKINALVIAIHITRLDPHAFDILQAVKDKYPSLKLYALPTFHNDVILKKTVSNGLIIPSPYYPEDKNQEFFVNSKKLWGGDETYIWRSPMSYDAAYVITEGLKRVLSSNIQLSPEEIRDRLEEKLKLRGKPFRDGVTGVIEFDDKGVRNYGAIENRTTTLLQIQNGKFVPIDTITPPPKSRTIATPKS
jgi:branched-chain amino acid transport system substrate-binding protein